MSVQYIHRRSEHTHTYAQSVPSSRYQYIRMHARIQTHAHAKNRAATLACMRASSTLNQNHKCSNCKNRLMARLYTRINAELLAHTHVHHEYAQSIQTQRYGTCTYTCTISTVQTRSQRTYQNTCSLEALTARAHMYARTSALCKHKCRHHACTCTFTQVCGYISLCTDIHPASQINLQQSLRNICEHVHV